jgi:hypothetical protein
VLRTLRCYLFLFWIFWGWLADKHLGLSLCARADMDVGMVVVDTNGINRRQLTRIIKISIITVLVTLQDSLWSR